MALFTVCVINENYGGLWYFEPDAVCHLWMTSGVKGLMKVNN